jgi:hypothetical protein
MVAASVLSGYGNVLQQWGISLQLMFEWKQWWSPQRTLEATASTLRGFLFTFFNRIIISVTGGCKIGYSTDYVVDAWWNFCSIYLRCKAIFGLSLHTLMDRTKQTNFVASAVADVTTTDFYLWGCLKVLIYSERVNRQGKLWH